MNKTLYNTAMEKITMSDECEERILNAINTPQKETIKKHKKIRFAPAFAAAAIIATGTIGVAAENGGFEWVKELFAKDSFTISNEVIDIIADFSNFSCESTHGLKISPVGMIADETTLYCIMHIDENPENIDPDTIFIADFFTESIPSPNRLSNEELSALNEEYGMLSYGSGMDYDEENNTIIYKASTSYKAFNDGDNVTIEIAEVPKDGDYCYDACKDDICATLNFDIKFGDMNNLTINYNEYNAVELKSTKFFIENMTITPLRVTTKGTKIYHNGSVLNDSLTFIMKDRSIVTATSDGYSISCDYVNSVSTQTVYAEWSFDSPINPDNIQAIYLEENCLYSKEKTE